MIDAATAFSVASFAGGVLFGAAIVPLSYARAAVAFLALGVVMFANYNSGFLKGFNQALDGVDQAVERALEEQDNLREGRVEKRANKLVL